VGAGCSVDIDQWGGIKYSLINRVNEPEGQLTVTQIFWDETKEYRASGSVPFTGEAGEYKITITNLTSAPK
jgi:hypothetical protein